MRVPALAIAIVMIAGAVRADPDDCARATRLTQRGDLTRARRLIDACPDGDPARAALERALDAKGYAAVEIVTKPAGAAVALDARPDLELHGGDELWLPPGSYQLRAGDVATTVVIKAGHRAIALLELRAARAPRTAAIDFGD